MTERLYSFNLIEKGCVVFPRRCTIKRILKWVAFVTFFMLTFAFVITFIIIPAAFMWSVEFQRLLMFTNVGLPSNKATYVRDLPPGARNLYLNFRDNKNESVSLGVWHILPSVLNDTVDFDYALAHSGFDVIIHFHGSGETRMDSKSMFVVLWDFFHVIAFDYRGYGDSTHATLSEDAIAADAVHLYHWVQNRTKNKIYIWGHSLGTALGTLVASKLSKTSVAQPAGLVLEAPFTSMREEIPVHPFGKIFAWTPWFAITILDPLERNGFRFDTRKYILDVRCPIMILHAVDDSIIPFILGKELYEIAAKNANAFEGKVVFHQFPPGYDHFWISQSPRLPFYIMDFIAQGNGRQFAVRPKKKHRGGLKFV